MIHMRPEWSVEQAMIRAGVYDEEEDQTEEEDEDA